MSACLIDLAFLILWLLCETKAKKDKFKVNTVPHTHDDVGWIKTVDQYYSGGANKLTGTCVRDILDSVVDQLLANSSRRFVYAELAFFWRWWRQQTRERQDQVKKLVAEEQLEFVNGGWTMNDEATTHYSAIIDQHFIGNKFLHQVFGEKTPSIDVAWQLDTFGHSYSNAELFSQMGFKAIFFSRLDYQQRKYLFVKSDSEFMWNLPGGRSLFTSIPYSELYGPPPGFCFDVLCSDDEIQADKSLRGYNLDQKAREFYEYILDAKKTVKGNSLMILMGNDFTYQQSQRWFRNIELLMAEINQNYNVDVFYSTPSKYMSDKLGDGPENVNSYYFSDFMPYQSHIGRFWTGFYSSRPALKWHILETNEIYQTFNQLLGLARFVDMPEILTEFDDATCMTTHHDAITGTERQAVADDYTYRLDRSRHSILTPISQIYSKLLNLSSPTELAYCQLNESRCSVSESGENAFTVFVYNPIFRTVVSVREFQ